MPREKLTELFRVRASGRLKHRVQRVARQRGCDESDVVREAIMRRVEEEEQRLGLPEMGEPAR